MIQKHIYWVIGILIILSVIQVSGLTGLGATISSSNIYTTGTDSSGLSFSTTTRSVTSQPETTVTGSQPVTTPVEKPPARWQQGAREGMYYDQVSKTSWVFDRILGKFFSPETGWFLVGYYSPGTTTSPPKLIRQYYYEPKTASFIDMNTGNVVNPEGSGTTTQTTTEITKKPTTPPELPPTVVPTVKPTTVQTTAGDPCIVPCSDCPEGKCRDCNHNGICDDSESGSQGGTSGGQSEGPQGPAQQTPTVTPTETVSGLSEKPQGTVLYQMMLPIINCTPKDNCVLCMDLNNNKICDPDEPKKINCSGMKGCEEDGVCWSRNNTGVCDGETMNWALQKLRGTDAK